MVLSLMVDFVYVTERILLLGLSHFRTFMQVKTELDQIREGQKLHGFLRYVEGYLSLMQNLIVLGGDYTVRVSWISFFVFCPR